MFGKHLPTDLLRTRTAVTPQRLAVVDEQTGTTWTYRDLDRAVSGMAAAVQSAGGDKPTSQRLAVALPPSPEFVFGAHAAMRSGWQLLPLNTRLSSPELATRLDRLDPSVVLCDEDTERTVLDAVEERDSPAGRAPEKVPILSVDQPATERVDSLPAGGRSVNPAPHGPQDTALVLFTSGTTGDPKGVRLTPQNLVSSAIASAFRLGVTPSDCWLCCLPMYHMGGLAPVFRSTLYGTTLHLQREFDAEETANLLSRGPITGVSLVPTQLSRLLDAGIEGSDLRTILLGGAPASQSLLDRADEAALPVYPTYGLTETASQLTTARPAEWQEHPGTVGHPLLGTTVRVVDDGTVVEPNEQGEIVVDGPTVTPGYLDEAKTQAAFSDLGFHTGDVGYRDEAGRLWVVGRLDETIITGGELVVPEEVAEQLRAVPGIEDAAVVGIADEEWGERVAALLVPSDGSVETGILREQTLEYSRERLADYKLPKTVRFVEEIPRTHSGTVDRSRARELLE